MATETVVIRVQADDRDAIRDLDRIERELKQLGTTAQQSARRGSQAEQQRRRATQQSERETRRLEQAQRRAARTTQQQSRAVGLASTRLRTLAKSAAAAGTAYVGISAAKGAVQSTTELARASLALNRNLGLSAKTASEFGAQAVARGADVTQLNMVFNTLAGRVRAARQGTESGIKTFRNLGISMRELRRDDPDELLFKITDGLKNLGGGFARAGIQRELFGRGAAKLAPLLREGSAELKNQLGQAEKLGATFNKVQLEDMSNFLVKQRQLELSTLGLKIAFTEAVIPA